MAVPPKPKAVPMPPPIASTSTYKWQTPVTTEKAVPTTTVPPPAPVPPRQAYAGAAAPRNTSARAVMDSREVGGGNAGQQWRRPSSAGGTGSLNQRMAGGNAFNMQPFNNQAGAWGAMSKAPMTTGRLGSWGGWGAR